MGFDRIEHRREAETGPIRHLYCFQLSLFAELICRILQCLCRSTTISNQLCIAIMFEINSAEVLSTSIRDGSAKEFRRDHATLFKMVLRFQA